MSTYISKIQFCASFRFSDYQIVFWGRQGKGCDGKCAWLKKPRLRELEDTNFQPWKPEILGHIHLTPHAAQNYLNAGTFTSLPLPAPLPEISTFNSNSWARCGFTRSLKGILHPITIGLLGEGSRLKVTAAGAEPGLVPVWLTSTWSCWKRSLQDAHQLRKSDSPSRGQGKKTILWTVM